MVIVAGVEVGWWCFIMMALVVFASTVFFLLVIVACYVLSLYSQSKCLL